ncbi:glycosyltransferase family 2 protein [Spiribacter halobius]|nr:glycosyltransferase [Spiribacter halobius]UEX77334.1 glycosyltransferase [Spiribacter halobius]
MTDFDPVTVSVVVPAYNGEAFLEEALTSAVTQTAPPAEIILVDDGSIDGTARIAKMFGPSVRYVAQENRGVAAAYNTGLKLASGQFVAFLEQDDVWEREKLECQLRAFQGCAAIGVVFCPVELRVEGGASKRDGINLLDGPGVYSFSDFFARNRILSCSTVMLRRSLVTELGGFREDMRLAFDYEMWLRMTCKYEARCVGEPLVQYRIHAGNLSCDENELAAALGSLKAIDIWAEVAARRKDVGKRRVAQRRKGLYLRLAGDYAQLRDRRRELEFLKMALSMDRFNPREWGRYIWRRIDPSLRNKGRWYVRRVGGRLRAWGTGGKV